MNVIFRVLDVMETIDDDCDNMDVVFVAVKVNRQISTMFIHCIAE